MTGATVSKPVRVAVATGTGERVDQHFATTPFFDIFDLDDSTFTFVNRRENSAGRCGCHDQHGGAIFEALTEIIKDCRFVVALRIGHGALSYLIERGIRAAQIDDTVENSLKQLLNSGKLKTLLRRQD